VSDERLFRRQGKPEPLLQEFTQPLTDFFGFLLGTGETKEEIVGIPEVAQSSVSPSPKFWPR